MAAEAPIVPLPPDDRDELRQGRKKPQSEGLRRIVLVGNPNVGKSVVFKNLTGRYVNISNYPGTTVEISRAGATVRGREAEVFDTPGVNDLAQESEEARVTERILTRHPEAVLVQVADAKNLRRALLLTLQLAELGRPMVLVLNMMDELERCGVQIDVDRLSEILGIPVVTTIAVNNHGTDRLIEALPEARVPRPADEPAAAGVSDYARNCVRLDRINGILSETYRLNRPPRPDFSVRLGFWAMHPVKGLFVIAGVLLFMFWFVGLLGAGTMVDLLETGLFQQRLNPLTIGAVDAVLPFPHTHAIEEVGSTVSLPLTPTRDIPLHTSLRTVTVPDYTLDDGAEPGLAGGAIRLLHDFLVGEYGVFTMALSYAFAIVFPIVTTFFLVFSLLEDSGFLPRLSIMVNRLFRLMGLSGKAVLPMVLGLGCATMATMTTRILETRRERLVTTLLLALAVPCSAQLGVLLAMMASLSFAAAAFWVGVVISVMLAVGWLSSRLFGGGGDDFLVEIPPMRRPQAANVATKTLARLGWYLREVIPLFVLGTAILFVLDRIGALRAIAAAGEPLVTGWLGLPRETIGAFLIGFMRRDFGAVYLLDAATGPQAILSTHQILVAMVTITLFMPCIATLFMIAKEHGRKVAAGMSLFIFPFAFLVGGLVHRLAGLLGL